jgi:hypothetical protein
VLRTNPWAFVIFTSTRAGLWPTITRRCSVFGERLLRNAEQCSSGGIPKIRSMKSMLVT